VRGESDLYSAGLVLFEMLTGKLPHEAASDLGRRLGPLQRAPDLRAFLPEAPRWLAAVVTRLLEMRPTDRYRTAEAVLGDLKRHRNPSRLHLRRDLLRAAAIAFFCLPQVGVLVTKAPAAKFSHLVPVGDSGIAAVSTTGERLWTIPGVNPEMADRTASVRLTPGGPHLIAIVLAPPREWSPERVSKLSFLDPETGQVVKQVKLPSGASFFPNDPPRFKPEAIKAVDLFQDDLDEVLVSYIHIPEAPSYTVFYSPRFDRARVIFYTRGGHRFQGATDLDGDGSLELIFVGINNGWNWVNAVAAVRLDPWPWTEAQWRANPTASPDEAEEPSKERCLLWYAVIPRGHLEDSCLTIDQHRHELTIRYNSGKTWALGFNGFPPKVSSAAASERGSARRETYGHLREAERLRRAGALDLALSEARSAFRSAEQARETWLGQYAERLEAKLFVSQGRVAEGEARFASLMERAEDAPEVAYDAAVAFHLSGRLRKAVSWYERGIGRESAMGAGKSKHEFLKGEVLALVQEKRYAEALEAVDRFGATYPPFEPHLWLFREYVRWRAGEPPRWIPLVCPPILRTSNVIGSWSSNWPPVVSRGRSFRGSIASSPNGPRPGQRSCHFGPRSWAGWAARERQQRSRSPLSSSSARKRRGASLREGMRISSPHVPAASARIFGESHPPAARPPCKETLTMLRLLAIHGHEEQVFAIPEGEARVGSAAENDFVLRVPGVSRRHALVRRCPGGIEVVDLGSKNGLLIEGGRVERAILTPGARLQIGAAWLEIEEISTSGEALAFLLQDSSGRAARPSLTTLTQDPGGELKSRSPADTALALAYHVARMGAGVPGKRNDLLARIRATLGAEAFASFERTRRGNLRIWERAGDFFPDEIRLLGSLVIDVRPSPRDQVMLRRSGQFLLAGRDTWFLGAKFAGASLAAEGWRRDLLRFLAHQLFLPVRSLDDLSASEASRALALARGNKRRTASLLGISPGTLYKLLIRSRAPKR
jgi:tetratricopeptide (TPR) repeat protein